jgi:protein-tyrosine phosphatase
LSGSPALRYQAGVNTVLFTPAQPSEEPSNRVFNWFGRSYVQTDSKIQEVSASKADLVPYTASTTVQRPSVDVIEASLDPKLYKIIPDLELYLGSQDAASNFQSFGEIGITHVLNVATGIDYERLPSVTYKTIEILDVPEADILPVLSASTDYISSLFAKGGKVLVHCNAGVSRSSSVVIAYLMQAKSMTFEEAYKATKAAKPDILPNEGFREVLKNRWKK